MNVTMIGRPQIRVFAIRARGVNRAARDHFVESWADSCAGSVIISED